MRAARTSLGRSSGALRTRDRTLALPGVALVLACLTGSYTSMAAPAPYPTPLAARAPGGGLVYEGLPVPESIAPAGETDSFTLDVDAGQTITVAVDPDAGLQPAVELFDPGSTSIGTAASGAAGEDAVLQAVPAGASGTYTVTVGGAGGTTGSYTVRVILNAAVEAEEHDGPTNDTLATAEDIDGSFISLGGAAERGAVLGALPPATGVPMETEDFETGSLGPAWSTYSSDAGGRIQVTGVEGTAAGAFALLMDRTPDGTYTLNEAVWTVDLSGFAQALLTFWHADVLDEEHTFVGDFVDHYNADGVAISDDGTNWHPVFSAPSQALGVWQEYTIDLAAEAAAAGMTLGANFQIKFQQYDNYALTTDGRGYDEIVISVPDVSDDWYSFTLSAGDSATLALTALGGGSVSLELYDGSATLLAAGATGAANVDGFIEDFGALAGGSYYVRVFGGDGDYSLVVTRCAGFDIEPNDDLAGAQDITGTGAALGSLGTAAPEITVETEPNDDGVIGGSVADLPFANDWSGSFDPIGGDDYQATLTGQISAGSDGDWDFFKILATPGDALVVDMVGNTLADTYLRLYDNTGVQIAFNDDFSGLDSRIVYNSFSYTGEYYVVADSFGTYTGTYTLTGTLTTSSPPESGVDFYRLEVVDGDNLTVTTSTPAGGPFEFVNALDPAIELYDPVGALVASDDNSLDGRNASLSHSAAAAGTYTVRVYAVTGSGEYVLSVSGNTGSPPPFEVTLTDPADGAVLSVVPAQMTVDFGEAVQLGTLDASDLTVDGVNATGYTITDGDTVVFDLAALVEGVHDAAVGAGAMTSLGGTPIEAYLGQFTVDLTAPRVISSSVQEGDGLPAGSLTYAVEFDEELNAAGLDDTDFALVGVTSGLQAPDSWSYDPVASTLTVDYSGLPEDSYTLTLLSGDGRFEDKAGWDLDGEPLSWPIPGNVSGDGAEGGDFVVNFATDVGTMAYPTPLLAKLPPGSLIYDPSAAGIIAPAADTDSFTLDVDAGQTITVAVDPDGGLQLAVELFDPGSTSIGAAAPGAAGEDAILQAVPASTSGTYTVTVGGAGGTTGSYTVRVILNAAVEAEGHDGPSNDTLATAQDIDGSFISLGGAAERGAVLGATQGVPAVVFSEDFEGGLGGFTVDNTFGSGNGLWHVSTGRGSDPGHSSTASIYYGQNEGAAGGGDYNTGAANGGAVYSPLISLPAGGQLTLSFNYFLDAEGGSWDEAAVAVDDGSGLTTILSKSGGSLPRTFAVWDVVTVDLSSYAGSDVTLRFSFDTLDSIANTYEGWYVDDVTITTQVAGTPDFYAFSLNAGDSATLAVTPLSPGSVGLELRDGAGTLLGVGMGGATNVGQFIENFLAPAGGTYYARLAGGDTDYSLVVTRSASFDIEPNEDISGAQDITGTGVALGAAQAGSGLGRLFAYDATADVIREIDPATGAVLNSFPSPAVAAGGPDFGLATTLDSILVGGSSADSIYELDPDTGATVRALVNPGLNVSGIAFLNGEVFLLTDSPAGQITVLDYNTGAVSRTITTSPVSVREGLSASANALLGTSGAGLYEIDPLTAATTALGALAGAGTPEGVGVIDGEIFIADFAEIEVYDLSTLAPKRTLTGLTNLEAIGADGGSKADDDYYAVAVDAGNNLSIVTSTPADGAFEFVNDLDPAIELYDPLGALVASDDNGAPDGKNAELTHAAASTGVYTVRVYGAAGSGEYVLSVSGQTGSPPPFEVTFTDPADGALLSAVPAQMTVEFSEAVQLGTLDAADLTIDGVDATGYTVVDGDTVVFDLPALAEGVHDVAVAAGAVTSLQGTPIEAYSGQFTVDMTPPGDVTSFTATAGDGEVTLDWVNPGDADFAGVLILRKTGGYPTGPGDAGATVIYDGSDETFVDTGLTNGTTYYYAAFTHDAVPNYAPGAFDSATPSDLTPPGDVTGFTATAGDGEVQLSWTNPGDADFAGVTILRKEGGQPSGPTDPAAAVVYEGSDESFVDAGLTNGTTYYYGAFAHDAVPNHASGVFESATPASPFAPETPASIAVPSGDADGAFMVSWSAVPGATSYEVEEASNPSFDGATVVYDGPMTSVSITARPEGSYWYRVRAANDAGSSDWCSGGPCRVERPANFTGGGCGSASSQDRAVLWLVPLTILSGMLLRIRRPRRGSSLRT